MSGINFIPDGQKELHLYSETGKPYAVSVSDEGALQIKNETTGESAGVGGGGGSAPKIVIACISSGIDYKGNNSQNGRGVVIDGDNRILLTPDYVKHYLTPDAVFDGETLPPVHIFCSYNPTGELNDYKYIIARPVSIETGGGYNMGGVDSVDFLVITPNGTKMVFHLESEAINDDGADIFCIEPNNSES